MTEPGAPGPGGPGGHDGEGDPAALAGRDRLAERVIRTGMFGTETTGDTSGYGGLQVRRRPRCRRRGPTAPTSTTWRTRSAPRSSSPG